MKGERDRLINTERTLSGRPPSSAGSGNLRGASLRTPQHQLHKRHPHMHQCAHSKCVVKLCDTPQFLECKLKEMKNFLPEMVRKTQNLMAC